MHASPPVFRFGTCRLDLAARELHRDGQLVPMSPKVFDCLAWLVEHRDRAVGRDELSAAVWGKADVTDNQLDQLIRSLRRVVNDTGSDQEVIRTVPRFGYRWVAELRPDLPDTGPIEALPAALPLPAPSGPATGPLRSGRRLHVIGGLVVLVLVSVLLSPLSRVIRGDREEPVSAPAASAAPGTALEPVPGPARLAVLPVRIDGTLDSEWAWLRLGLMDLIATRLHEGGLAAVPSSNIVALAKNDAVEAVDPATVRAATGARLVVAPSLRKTPTGWRLHVEVKSVDGDTREVEVHAADAIAGARAAADRVLVLLGRTPGTDAPGATLDEETLIRRVDAAMDGHDDDTARQLLGAIPPALGDSAPLRVRKAELEVAAGRTEAARTLLQSVLDDRAQRPLDAETHSRALFGLAALDFLDNRNDAARDRLNETIRIAQQAHLSLIYGSAMRSRAVLHAVEGNDAEADGDFAQARIAMELAGDTLGLAELEASQAGTLIARHRFAEAQALQDRAIARLERFPPGDFLRAAFGNKIYLHMAMLQPRDALAVAGHARLMLGTTWDADWSTRLHEVRALIASGRLDEAQRDLDAAAAAIDPARQADLYSALLANQAQLALVREDWTAAVALATRVTELRAAPALSAPHYARGHSGGWRILTQALRRQGAIAEAARQTQRFAAWASTLQDPSIALQVRLSEAEQAAAEHRTDAAITGFEQALALTGRAAPSEIAMVAVAYGRYLIDIGRLTEATRVVGRVAQWVDQEYQCAVLQAQLYHALGQQPAWKAALAKARDLAGERTLPAALATWPTAPAPAPAASGAATAVHGESAAR